MNIPLREYGKKLHAFWFRRVSATGFGLMRIGFGATGFMTFLFQITDVQRYYGPEGILPHSLVSVVLRDQWRFSLLDHANAFTVQLLYYSLLLGFVLVAFGIGTRMVLGVLLILLFSFHEYGNMVVDGGDSMLRIIGFILFLSPCNHALSVDALRKKLPSTMPIWPYRLLLWQIIVGYVFSGYAKLIGPAWRSGSAIATILHVEDTARLSAHLADRLTPLSPIFGTFTIVSQLAWILLLVLPLLSSAGIRSAMFNVKRILMFCGLLVHLGIFFTMNIGVFPLIVLVAYLGLLEEDDIRIFRHCCSLKRKVMTIATQS